MTDHLASMVEAAADPVATLKVLAGKTGRQAMLVFPMYFPREVLDSAGFIPAEIWGAELPLGRSAEFLQPTVCSLVTGLFELGLSGKLGKIAGAVFPSTCDTVQNSEGIWASRLQGGFVGHVVMPKIMSAPGAAEFIEAQIREFIRGLEKAAGVRVTAAGLREAIARANRARSAARGLLDLGRAGKLGARERNAVCTLYNLLPPDEFIKFAAPAIEQVKKRGEARDGTPVLVSGMVMGPWSVVDLYDSLGAVIVEDDLGTGRRSIDPDVDEQGDPIAALAMRQLGRRPCCTIHDSTKDRSMSLVDEVMASGARGVIFSRLKFCDPESFDYPFLSSALKEAGIPSQLLEIDLGSSSTEAVATRMQAFLEGLS